MKRNQIVTVSFASTRVFLIWLRLHDALYSSGWSL